ncbi:hypothetical protein SAE02_25260 [Skermanella aerolata]|uniref:Glycosyltransferase 2-like domain-containing protein n=1 Tax=Skermanella aerolata TaxID=393310 RepID=A0A512DPI1_9PROT|nr:glycosyltransferase [Skermanella aerolata]GEO38378.1 hypothetical protein SAE02_25260 [Skermanella aerolata]
MRTDEMPEGEVADRPREGRLLIYAFPPGEGFVERSISSAEYRNRADFVDGVHVEYRGDVPPEFELATFVSAAWPHRGVTCSCTEPGAYTRFNMSFSLRGAEAGDLIHLRWLARVGSAACDEAEADLSLMTSDAGKGGKTLAGKLPALRSRGGGWSECYAILQVLDPQPDGLLHLVFSLHAGTVLDVAALEVLRCGARPLPSAASLPLPESGPRIDRIGDCAVMAAAGPEARRGIAAGGEFGILNTVDMNGISGVAWNPAQPSASVPLELHIDGELVSVLIAEPLSGGASPDEMPPPGHFRMAMPPQFLDDRDHGIDVRFADGGASLWNCPLPVRLEQPFKGLVQLGADGHLVGWASDRRQTSAPVRLEILVDGQVAGEVIADLRHPVLAGAAYNEGRCAFRLPLPDGVQDGLPHLVDVRAMGGAALQGSPIAVQVCRRRYMLHVEAVGTARLTGWAVDTEQPATPLTLEVRIDGRMFGIVRADRRSAALDAADGGVRQCGFSIPLPGGARHVAFHRAGSDLIAAFDLDRAGNVAAPRPSVPLSGQEDAAKPGPSEDPQESFRRLFDADWYLAAYPLAAVEIDRGVAASASAHWLAQGAAQGWNPTFWFDETWYLAHNDDAAAAVATGSAASGFLHWLATGSAEWRRPGPVFDPAAHRQADPLSGADGREVVAAWLAALSTPPKPLSPAIGSGTAAPPAASTGRQVVLRNLVALRRGPETIYDAYVDRLIRDLSLTAGAEAQRLRQSLDDNEADIAQWLIEHPVAGEPLVTVIMPTFNRGFLIAEAIQSILDQTWKNWELIVCDDGSTDKTSFVVKHFKDPRIRYLQLEKANGAIARNFGLKFSRGDYIAFLDSDNMWHPFFLSLSVGALMSSARPMAYSGYIDTRMTGARLSEGVVKFRQFDYQALLSRNFIDLNTIVIDRAVYDFLGGFDETLPRVQDWDLVLKYSRLIDPVEIPSATAFYRRNEAWGQVTDLFGQTNFNDIVRETALERLRSGRSALRPGSRRRFVLTLISQADGEDAGDLFALAELLRDIAEIRLLVPDIPRLRAFAERTGLAGGAGLVWLNRDADILRSLAGEGIVIGERFDWDGLRFDPGVPVLRLGRDAERTTIAPSGPARTSMPLGALQLCDFNTLPSADTLARSGLDLSRDDRVMVFVDGPARPAWTTALAGRSRSGPSALLVSLGDDHEPVVESVEKGEVRPVHLTPQALLGTVRHCAAVVLTAGSAADRLLATNLAVAALGFERVLLAVEDPVYSSWIAAKCAHRCKSVDSGPLLEQVKAAIADPNKARVTARGRRWFDHLYQWESMRDRAELSLNVMLKNRESGT